MEGQEFHVLGIPNLGVELWNVKQKKGPLKNSDMILIVISMVSNFGTQREKKTFHNSKVWC
jgi:hypothetical protein